MSKDASKFIRLPGKHSATEAVSDKQLILRIRQGDPQAWATLLNRYTDVIYRRACDYSRTSRTGVTPEDREDEVADLYLFMANYLKRSLKSFQGKCKPATWILGIIANRPRILKAYLLHKAPDRTDVRLPRILASRSKTDREIFKRLVWGFDPAYIAQDLHISEAQCWEIENLLAENSPRVYERIRANRTAGARHIHMDEERNGDTYPACANRIDPERALMARESQRLVQSALQEGMRTFSTEERRLLILLYNKNLKPAEIVRLAAADANLGLSEIDNINRIYYLKDRALNKIYRHIRRRVDPSRSTASSPKKERNRLAGVETYLSECGLPV